MSKNEAFGTAAITPPLAPVAISARHTEPSFASPIARYVDGVGEFERGMGAFGFDSIKPQQHRIAEVLSSTDETGAPLYGKVAVDVPRRSGKSETVMATAIGRCLSRPRFRAAITYATTATKLGARFRNEVADRLSEWNDAQGGDVLTVRLSNGQEGVTFANGSTLQLLPPKGSAFRSEAFDLVVVDESGEADRTLTETLLQAILPTMDTRPTAQLIVAGTPAEFRTGNLLWDVAQRAVDGKADYGLIRYGYSGELTLEDIETWAQVAPLVQAHHPGLDPLEPLTTLARMEGNYDALGPMRFAREYLGQFGQDVATSGIINPAKWQACQVDAPLPDLPSHFAVGFGVSHDQAFSAVVAAWRDADGRAVLGVLEYRPGTAWLVPTINDLATAHVRVAIAHDSRGAVTAEAEKIRQARNRTVLSPQSWPHVQTAAALLVREVHTGNLVHYGQTSLSDAALFASRRGDDKSYAFGRPSNAGQIVALEAASMALRMYDETPPRAPIVGMVI